MTWHVQYKHDAKEIVFCYTSPELAIQAACKLIDYGYEVFGIGTGPLTDCIDYAHICKICALRGGSKP